MLGMALVSPAAGRWRPSIGMAVEIGEGEIGSEQTWRGGSIVAVDVDGRLTVRMRQSGFAKSRRRDLRVPSDLELAVRVPGSAKPLAATCVDLSEGGLQAILPLEFEVGDSLRLVLTLPDGTSAETTARVVSKGVAGRYGLAFELSLGERDQVIAAALRRAGQEDGPSAT